jgi:hypothetical protein
MTEYNDSGNPQPSFVCCFGRDELLGAIDAAGNYSCRFRDALGSAIALVSA